MILNRRSALLVLITAGVVLLAVLADGPWRQGTAFTFLYILPAATWYPLLPGDRLLRPLLAAAWVMLLVAIGTLWLSYLPGPLFRPVFLVYLAAVLILPLLWRSFAESWPAAPLPFRTRPRRMAWLAAATLLILFLRFGQLGYKEIQGDEGILLTRAAAALSGVEDALFLHQKGPAEILLPMAAWSAGGALTESWARLPFAWASTLSVLLLGGLGRRWFGRPGGWIALLLMGVMGFSLAFARIVQYQSLVLLWSLAALAAAAGRPAESSPWQRLLPGLFLAGGLLAHYDAVLFAPAVGWLLLGSLAAAGRPRAWWTKLKEPLLGGGLLAATFYVPYVLHPNFGPTLSYLLNDRVGLDPAGELAGGRWPDVWRMLTFYNSTYYVIGLFLLAAAGLLLFVWRPAARFRLATVALLAGVPLFFYTVIVTDPRTHVYTLFPGLILLAAAAGQLFWRRLPGRPATALVGGLFAAWLAVSGFYVYLMFVDIHPERQRTWTENRPAGYWTTWSDPPAYGLFGFPYQAGWRAATALLPRHPLAGYWYGSNEEPPITNWYMAQSPRTSCPTYDYFFLAENVQDPVPYDPADLAGMVLQGEVVVDGVTRLRLYGREPVETFATIDSEEAELWRTPADLLPPPPVANLNLELGDQARLLGYAFARPSREIEPGGRLVVILYWQALRPFDRNFQSFVHLLNADRQIISQHDSAPDCGFRPTTGWEPGEVIWDVHTLDIPADLAAGSELSLVTGLYDLLTYDRLPVEGLSNDLIPLPAVTIGAPPP